ncbi:MAG TPA: helix-turn-helix domain-containing protein [Candidatus Angelobacter sp.]|nr:helix-turn-helix domain-containing protein [Candidatus Angelobacter sp.]
MKAMLQYDWPGNVRELENCIERAIALGDHDSIELQDLPPAVRGEQANAPEFSAGVEEARVNESGKPAGSATDLEELERATIERVFIQVQGDKSRARKMLGISRATLYRKLKRYKIGEANSSSAAS